MSTYRTTTALGMEDSCDSTYLFQYWHPERLWSEGEGFDFLEDALSEQRNFNSLPRRENTPTRVVEVETTIKYRCIEPI